MRDDKQKRFNASEASAVIFDAVVFDHGNYAKHTWKDSGGTSHTVAISEVKQNATQQEHETDIMVHHVVDHNTSGMNEYEEILTWVKNNTATQSQLMQSTPTQTQPQRTESDSQHVLATQEKPSDSGGFDVVSSPTEKKTTASTAPKQSVLDAPAEKRTIYIIPEIGFGRTHFSRHIRLVVVTQEIGMTFQNAYEKKQVFDPRDFGLGAQSTLDDTNCGRYVAAMTIQAAGLARDGAPITKENLAASPAVQRALHFNTTEDAKAGLQNAYVKPLSKDPTPQEIIDHNLAKIRCLKAEYEARIKAERKYHGSGVAGYSTATLLTSKIAAFFGKAYSATDKLAAVNAILKSVKTNASGGNAQFYDGWMEDIKPKVFGAARQGELGKCVSAIAQAQIILRQYHPNPSHQPRSR